MGREPFDELFSSCHPSIRLGTKPMFTDICNLKKQEFVGCGELRELPRNLGDLTLLRSLNVSSTGIRELPESLTSNLSKLELVYLGFLGVFCKIPKNIQNWVELRKLRYLGETKGIEMLTCLEILHSYSVRKREDSDTSDSSGLEELANLKSLQSLEIIQLENGRGKEDSERAKLKDKQNMVYLELHWKEDGVEEELANNSDMVFEGLQPHPNLRDLRVECFPGSKFPKWMGVSSCLQNLVELFLSECIGCEKLPALGILPCLKVLWIDGLSSVKCLGEEFYYQEEEEESKGSSKATTTAAFPALIELTIVDMKQLEMWLSPPSPYNSFPVLEKLSIQTCDVLTNVPDLRLWTSLRELYIYSCDSMIASIPYHLKYSLHFVKRIEIY